ncbi:MAG TPA: DUF4340 domain-containing protein [Gemmataceae bacterium]|nr:DUF4340 domain-containing protein [Gemmataceae bacterium]
MRGLRSTIALLVVLAGLGAYIYFVTWKQPDTAASGKKLDKVFNVAADKIGEIKVTSSSGETATARKDGGTWKLVEPTATAADESEVSAMATTLSNAEVVRVVDENPGNLNDYGLSNPRVAIDFKAEGDKEFHKLFLGEKTPTGSDLFARRNDEKKVFLVAAYQETSLNKTAFDLRDKNILKIDRDKIDSIDLSSGAQTVTLAKDGSEWRLKKPVDGRADYGTVEGLIGKLQTTKMKSIVADSVSAVDLKKYGLDKPQATVDLHAGSAKATLLLGGKAEDNTVYARDASKPMIVTVESSLLDDVKKTPDDYRRKDLFEFRAYNATHVEITHNGQTAIFDRVKSDKEGTPDKWRRASPNAGDVDKDKFDAFLAKLANMRADKFVASTSGTGLDKPAMTIAVKFDEGKKEERVSFGQSGSDVYAARPGEPGAAKTEAADFNESIKSLEELSK